MDQVPTVTSQTSFKQLFSEIRGLIPLHCIENVVSFSCFTDLITASAKSNTRAFHAYAMMAFAGMPLAVI
jgi:hypothetical protein